MRNPRAMAFAVAVAVAVAAGPGFARAADLPKLPEDRAMKASEGSPGAVTFRHSTHVDPARPACISCHPRLFKMLEPATAENGSAIKHDAMEQGRHCGACHGKGAFAFDRCDACHG